MKSIKLFSLALLGVVATHNASAQGLASYEVTVLNATNNMQFTPIFAVTHRDTATPLFTLGEPARPELEDLAEGGSPAALEVAYDAERRTVVEIATAAGTPADGPLTFAGQSATFDIRAHRGANYISIAAMLLPTNDTFMALNAVKLPSRRGRSITVSALGYDAGTELNDEFCVNIPGPTCGGEGTNTERNDRVDGVHISAGISGGRDLNPSVYNWRNPVAFVTITRLN